MNYTKQDIYDQFNCIASRCPESCCALWQIVIDDQSYARFEACQDVVADRLHEGMVSVDGEHCFKQCQRRCAMLDEDDLCYLQRHMGEAFLCDTCRQYPRHLEEYEGEKELSLSLSCPEAARQMLTQADPMGFETYEVDEDEEEYEEFDYLLYTKLQDARALLYDMIQDRSLSMQEIFHRIISLTLTLQESLDENEIFEMDDVLTNPREKARNIKAFTTYDEEKRLFSKLYELEELHDDWMERIEKTWSCVFASEDKWNAWQALFGDHVLSLEQILMSLTYTYFCGAVYDDLIYAKAAFCIFSTRFMVYFAVADFFAGQTTVDVSNIDVNKMWADDAFMECMIRATYSYAREIEHSDCNLEIMEEWFDEGSYFYL